MSLLQHESGAAKAAENFLLRGKLRETEAALAAAQDQLKETQAPSRPITVSHSHVLSSETNTA